MLSHVHIEKLPSGSYRVTVQHNGSKVRRTYPTRKAAKIGAADLLKQLVADSGARQRRRTRRWSVGELVDRHVEQTDYAATTRAEIVRARSRIPAWLADLDADEVTTPDLGRAYDELREALSESAVRRVHELLSVAFGRGVRWGWVRSNPTTAVEPPRQQRRVADPVDAAALAKVVAEVAHNAEHAVLVRLAVVTGARRGELAGLRWGDVDVDAQTVRIERAVICTPQSGLVVKDTKTGKSGRRTVSIDAGTAQMVRLWRDGLAADEPVIVEADHYVFGTLDRPARPDTITQFWVRACHRAGVSGIRWHDLRHHSASVLIGAGVDPVTVAHRLGHANPSTTLRIYSHLVPGRDRAAADLLADRLG